MIPLTAKQWNFWAKVMCALAAIPIIVGAVLVGYRWRYLRRANTAIATITNLIPAKDHDGDILYAPVYVFTDQHGQSVKIISSSSSFPPPGEIGDKVEILYDPAEPQDSILDRFFDVWGVAAIVGGLGVFYTIVFAAVALLTARHLRKAEARVRMSASDS